MPLGHISFTPLLASPLEATHKSGDLLSQTPPLPLHPPSSPLLEGEGNQQSVVHMAAARSTMDAATCTSSPGQGSHDKQQQVIELHLGFRASDPTPAATGEFLFLLLSISLFLFLMIFSSLVAAVDERYGHKLGGEAPSPWTTSSPPGPVAAMDGEDDDT